jgi:hypothetical protein
MDGTLELRGWSGDDPYFHLAELEAGPNPVRRIRAGAAVGPIEISAMLFAAATGVSEALGGRLWAGVVSDPPLGDRVHPGLHTAALMICTSAGAPRRTRW